MACYLLTIWGADERLRSTLFPILGYSIGNLVSVADILGTMRLISEYRTLGRPFSGLAVNHFIEGRTKCVVHCGFQLNHRGSSFPLFLRVQAGYSS